MLGAILRGDVAAHMFQISERHMRYKFSAFKVEPGAAQSLGDLRLQMFKRWRWGDARPQGARPFSAKKSETRKADIELRRLDLRQRQMRIGKAMAIHIANKSQRQMEIFNRAPMRTVNPVLEC